MAGWTKPNCCAGCCETEGVGASSNDDTSDASCASTDTCNGKGLADDTDYSGNCCACLAGETVENVPCAGSACAECVAKECSLSVESEGSIL